MKKWQAESLVEHPGHPDQSVHGRRHGNTSGVPKSITKVYIGGSKDFKRGSVTIIRKNPQRRITSVSGQTYMPTKTSRKQLNAVLASKVRTGEMTVKRFGRGRTYTVKGS